MTDKLVKELRRKRPESKKQKFPATKKAFKNIVKDLAEKYGHSEKFVEEVIREKGLPCAIKALKQSPPSRKRPILSRLRRLWSRRQ